MFTLLSSAAQSSGSGMSVMVWTQEQRYLPAEIFLNGSHVGTLTQHYLTAPPMNAPGCVMIEVDRTRENTIRAVYADNKEFEVTVPDNGTPLLRFRVARGDETVVKAGGFDVAGAWLRLNMDTVDDVNKEPVFVFREDNTFVLRYYEVRDGTGNYIYRTGVYSYDPADGTGTVTYAGNTTPPHQFKTYYDDLMLQRRVMIMSGYGREEGLDEMFYFVE
jgi:hypothetical protein